MSTLNGNTNLREIEKIKNRATAITTKEGLENALTLAGLNYVVEKEERKNPRRGNEVTGRFEIYRADTGHMLGADRTDRYNIIQNSDALSIIADFAQAEGGPVYLSNAQVFDNGSWISISVDMGHMLIGDPKIGDVVMKRITITNSHDGSGSTRVIITPFRLKCSNGQCTGSAESIFSVRHTGTAQEKMKEISRVIRGVQAVMRKTEATYQVLTTAAVRREQFDAVLDFLFPLDKGGDVSAKNQTQIRKTVALNYQMADGGFIERDTGWNLFNSITHYTNHDAQVRVHDENGNETQARAASLIGGNIAKTNQRALSRIVEVLDLDDDIARMLRKVETSQAATLATYEAKPLSIFDLEVGV